MKTWLTIRAHAWQIATSLALVLAATVFVSGATVASDDEGFTIDPAMQAAWLYDHFRCEHGAEMAPPEPVIIDPAMQAAWLWDHFCCEHAAEMNMA